jgi:hypothetical protein
VALSVAACQQTVVLDQRGGDASVGADSRVPECNGPPVQFFVEYPEVMVALDRSSGMAARFGDGTVVLNAAREAIGVHAARYKNVVHFGYVEFPGSAPGCSQSPQAAACCASLASPPNINFAAFEFALDSCEQGPASCTVAGYQRPTVPALTSCAQVFFERPDEIRRYVLLVTNGRPDCGFSQNSPCTDALNAANQLANNQGVNTVVVAPGQLHPDDTDCLQRIAIQGGDNMHPASNPGELDAEFAGVIRRMATGACHLDVTMRIQEPERVVLRWKDMPIPRHRNGVDGWDLLNNNYEIELHGEWCERFIDGAPTDVTLYTDCDPQR